MPRASRKVSKPEPTTKTFRLSRARRAAILKALADPHRLELVERIARAAYPLGCAEARKTLAISRATLSHHIKELESAGLIHAKRDGKYIFLTLRAEVLVALSTSLSNLVHGCSVSQ